MAEPKVSIHIIAYNQKDYIREAIDSALAQDYPNFEVVVGDDASTDGTAEIIADYARLHPGKLIPVLGESNRGVTANSNAALKACTGELIAFTGGDDVLLPGKIAAQAQWFASHPEGVLCGHQVEVFYDDGSAPPHPLSRKLRTGRGAGPIIRQLPFGATAVMVRSDRIPAHGFEESLPMVSDQLMWVEVVREDGEWGHVPETLARYRRHSANVSGDPFRYLHEVERSLDLMEERFPAFARYVEHARTQRLHYDQGISLMKRGHKAEARRAFLSAIRREPLFAKAWVRLTQSML